MKKSLQFVHIGKCAGSSLAELLPKSPIVANKYSHFYESHVNGVNLDSECDYLISLRNPISRAISAFQWRKKLVLSDADPDQVSRFSGEKEVLDRYGSLSELSKHLYASDGKLVQNTARDFRLIHHLRESISFYLSPLLPILSKNNVFGIICQETFATDCERILGIYDHDKVFERKNFNKKEDYVRFTTDSCACGNLKRFLVEDYLCITQLWALGLLESEKYQILLGFPGK